MVLRVMTMQRRKNKTKIKTKQNKIKKQTKQNKTKRSVFFSLFGYREDVAKAVNADAVLLNDILNE